MGIPAKTPGGSAAQQWVKENQQKFADVAALSHFYKYEQPVNLYQHLVNIRSAAVKAPRHQTAVKRDYFDREVTAVVKQWKEDNYPMGPMKENLAQAVAGLRPKSEGLIAEGKRKQASITKWTNLDETPTLEKSKKVAEVPDQKSRGADKQRSRIIEQDSSGFETLEQSLGSVFEKVKADLGQNKLFLGKFEELGRKISTLNKHKSDLLKRCRLYETLLKKKFHEAEVGISNLKRALSKADSRRAELQTHISNLPLTRQRQEADVVGKEIDLLDQAVLLAVEGLIPQLVEVNRRLAMKESQVKGKEKSVEEEKLPKVHTKNAAKSWEECFGQIEDQIEAYGVTFNQEDFRQVFDFCQERHRDGHEVFDMSALLEHLGRRNSESRGVEKLIVDRLPILSVHVRNTKMFMDARVFFWDPNNIYHLFAMVMEEEDDKEEEKRIRREGEVSTHPVHPGASKRQPGGGRMRVLNREDIEELKSYMSQIGGQADPRRKQDGVDLFGARFGGATWKGEYISIHSTLLNI